MLDLPYRDGGVGLYKNKAKRVTDYLQEIIEKRKGVDDMYEALDKNPEVAIFDEVHTIRNWLIKDQPKKLTHLQIVAFDQVISDRIRRFIPQEKVVEILNLSAKKFGVGFSFRTAQVMAEKLELILSDSTEQSTVQMTKNTFEKKL